MRQGKSPNDCWCGCAIGIMRMTERENPTILTSQQMGRVLHKTSCLGILPGQPREIPDTHAHVSMWAWFNSGYQQVRLSEGTLADPMPPAVQRRVLLGC
jgi:hypothetical protein